MENYGKEKTKKEQAKNLQEKINSQTSSQKAAGLQSKRRLAYRQT